jgi:hypothetical protein
MIFISILLSSIFASPARLPGFRAPIAPNPGNLPEPNVAVIDAQRNQANRNRIYRVVDVTLGAAGIGSIAALSYGIRTTIRNKKRNKAS